MACSDPVIHSEYMLRWLLDVSDSNFGNWRILVVNANCDHEYVDPVTFFNAMLPNTFLDLTDTPSDYIWHSSWLVRVNSAGNWLEFIDPTALWIWLDRLVASQSWANPWYLNDVLQVIPWELTKTLSWDDVILGIDPAILASLATNFLDLTDTPTSYSWQAWRPVVVNPSETWLIFDPNFGKEDLRARRYMAADLPITQWINIADSSFVIDNMTWFDWNISMQWTYGWVPSIVIPKRWTYMVTIRWNMKFTPWVVAWRVFAYSTTPTSRWPICDVKFWSTDAGNWHWAYPRDMVVSYWQKMLYSFDAWTHILTWWIISTTVWPIWWWIVDWSIVILHWNIRGSWADDRWHTLEVSRFSSDYS